ALGLLDGGLERIGREDDAVDGEDLLSGDELRVVGGASPTDVGDGAIVLDADAEGVPDVGAGMALACGVHSGLGFAEGVGVYELVAALLDAFEVCVRGESGDAAVEEGGPVVGDDLVEVLN